MTLIACAALHVYAYWNRVHEQKINLWYHQFCHPVEKISYVTKPGSQPRATAVLITTTGYFENHTVMKPTIIRRAEAIENSGPLFSCVISGQSCQKRSFSIPFIIRCLLTINLRSSLQKWKKKNSLLKWTYKNRKSLSFDQSSSDSIQPFEIHLY